LEVTKTRIAGHHLDRWFFTYLAVTFVPALYVLNSYLWGNQALYLPDWYAVHLLVPPILGAAFLLMRSPLPLGYRGISVVLYVPALLWLGFYADLQLGCLFHGHCNW